jgi:molecular chaperone DnaK
MQAQALTPQDIDEVILVGGQTRMPLIHQRLTEHFGKPPHRNVHPDEAVAIGTSLLAYSFGRSDQIRLIDVLAMSIGVGLPGGRFKPIITRNTKLPFHKVYTIGTTRDNQSELDIVIFQGENDHVSENEYLGTLSLNNIPQAPKGQVRFEIKFQLNNESLLTVTARNTLTNEVHEVVMTTQDTPQDLQRKLDISEPPPGQPNPGPLGLHPPPLPGAGVQSPPMAPMNAGVAPAKKSGRGGMMGWLKRLLGRR